MKQVVEKLSGVTDFDCDKKIESKEAFFQLLESICEERPDPEKEYSEEFLTHVEAKKRAKILDVFTQAFAEEGASPPFAGKLELPIYTAMLDRMLEFEYAPQQPAEEDGNGQ